MMRTRIARTLAHLRHPVITLLLGALVVAVILASRCYHAAMSPAGAESFDEGVTKEAVRLEREWRRAGVRGPED